MARRVVILGSINVDLVIETERLPGPGETVGGGRFVRYSGGKGANQAVAARRLGADVQLVGRVGRDGNGAAVVDELAAEGVDTSRVLAVDDLATGVALIVVDEHGENQIAVAPGANDRASAVDPVSFVAAGVLLASLEVPMASVVASAICARTAGWDVIVNPAPATALPDELKRAHPILTPNERELALLTGLASVEDGARALRSATDAPVIVTCGTRGAVMVTAHETLRIPAPPVSVRDTTGAGDVFNGVLAAALAEARPLEDAARLAVVAASLSVESAGARAAPTREELARRFPGLMTGRPAA